MKLCECGELMDYEDAPNQKRWVHFEKDCPKCQGSGQPQKEPEKEDHQMKIKEAVRQHARILAHLLANNPFIRIGGDLTWKEHWELVSRLSKIANDELVEYIAKEVFAEQAKNEDVKLSEEPVNLREWYLQSEAIAMMRNVAKTVYEEEMAKIDKPAKKL